MKISEESLHELQDIIKRNNLCIIGDPEGEEREKWTGRLFKEITPKNFSNLGRDTDIQVS